MRSLETSYHRNCCNPTHDTEQISTVQGALSTGPTILSSSAGCRPVAQWQRGDTRPAGEGSIPGGLGLRLGALEAMMMIINDDDNDNRP